VAVAGSVNPQGNTARVSPAPTGALAEAFAGLAPEERADRGVHDLALLTVPEVWAANLRLLPAALEALSELVAERTGRSSADPAVRALTSAFLGVGVRVLLQAAHDPAVDPVTAMDEELSHLEEGVSLVLDR